MAHRIARETIREILARVDLVDLVEARVPLKRSGANFVARCPFHTEKTPSFNVSRTKQFYHCYGCGAHGNAIDFLMEYDRLGFVEAVETLADAAGIELARSEENRSGEALRDDLYAVQERAASFYQLQLRQHPDAARAVAYLQARGVSGELARRFRLGYAPAEWRNLPAQLPADRLEAAGLLTSRDGHRYDRFRDRIMFPIRDRRGRVVGFGGRVLGEGSPKYLNSPETPVFRKHREVYGLFELLEVQRKPAQILVVEGYMDVIALAQHGLNEVVATLGTATSNDQVELLFRQTSELVFCFDGDTAGRQAAWKALEASLPSLREGRSLRFLLLPEGHDPDSLVRSEGAEAFRQRVAQAKPFSQYFLAELRARVGGVEGSTSLEQGASLRNLAAPLLARMPSGSFREELERLLENLSGELSVKPLATPRRMRTAAGSASGARPPSLLRSFLALLLQNPALGRTIDPELRERLEAHPKAGALVGQILSLLDRDPTLTAGAILEHFRGSTEERLISQLQSFRPEDRAADELENCVERVFADAATRLGRQLQHERLEALVRKDRATGLTPAEREELRRLTLP